MKQVVVASAFAVPLTEILPTALRGRLEYFAFAGECVIGAHGEIRQAFFELLDGAASVDGPDHSMRLQMAQGVAEFFVKKHIVVIAYESSIEVGAKESDSFRHMLAEKVAGWRRVATWKVVRELSMGQMLAFDAGGMYGCGLMKHLFIALVLFTTSLHAGLVIVQDVVSKGTGMDMNMQLTMKVADDSMRIDVGDQISTIVDGKSGDVISLMHGQKMAMVMKGEQIKALVAQINPGGEKPEAMTPTGNKETIRGYETEEYIQKHAGNTIRFWLAKDFPNYKSVIQRMNQAGKAMGSMMPGSDISPMDPESLNGMPIRTVLEMEGGGTFTTELVSVEEQELAKDLFEQPEGYKSMAMPTGAAPANP